MPTLTVSLSIWTIRAVLQSEFPSASARNCEVENGWISIQIEVGRAIGQGDSPATGATPRLRMAMTTAILHQQRLPERHAVVAAVPIRAVQCFPVHCILDQ